MRGYGLSLGIGGAIYLLLYFVPLFAIPLGFFGGILLAVLAEPFRGLGGQTSYAIAIFGPSAIALVSHVVAHRREGLFKDSALTIIATAWLAVTAGIVHFLCHFGMRCSGPWPFV